MVYLQNEVYSNGSYSYNEDRTSQLRYIIVLSGTYSTANHNKYDSMTLRRVVRYLLAVKLFALSDFCDTAIIIEHTLKHILV